MPTHSVRCKQTGKLFTLVCNEVWNSMNAFVHIFPECVARVPVSPWWFGGWSCVRQTLRNRPQPFAAVRACPRDGRMAVPIASFAKHRVAGVPMACRHFRSFQTSRTFVRVAAVALCDIPTCVMPCRNSWCVSGANFSCHFQKMSCSFRAQHFGDLQRHFAWQGQHFRRRVACFCESHCCVKWWQRANSLASVAFVGCDENWRKPRTKHRFWGRRFGFHEKML